MSVATVYLITNPTVFVYLGWPVHGSTFKQHLKRIVAFEQ